MFAGFGWRQGWNDRINHQFNAETYRLIGEAMSEGRNGFPAKSDLSLSIPRHSLRNTMKSLAPAFAIFLAVSAGAVEIWHFLDPRHFHQLDAGNPIDPRWLDY